MQVAIWSNKQEMKANKQDSDEKMMKLTEDFKAVIASSITSITYHINYLK